MTVTTTVVSVALSICIALLGLWQKSEADKRENTMRRLAELTRRLEQLESQRVVDAEFRGRISSKLENVEAAQREIKNALERLTVEIRTILRQGFTERAG